jgi:hypothetical protein
MYISMSYTTFLILIFNQAFKNHPNSFFSKLKRTNHGIKFLKGKRKRKTDPQKFDPIIIITIIIIIIIYISIDFWKAIFLKSIIKVQFVFGLTNQDVFYLSKLETIAKNLEPLA